MIIVIDIGGTKTRVVGSSDGKEFIGEPVVYDTPQNFEEGMKQLGKTVKEVAGGEKIEALVCGAPGPLNKDRSELSRAPNLVEWAWKPLKNELQEIAGDGQVILENDTALVGLGEATNGTGKGHKIVAYMTVSTGVGGVRILNGKIEENALGFEPGHQIINFDGPNCTGCGVNGHLESYVCGRDVEARYKMKPYEIADPKIWDELAKYLAYGVNNTLIHWSPDILVIGGSMMKRVGIPLDAVRQYVKQFTKILPAVPPIELASLGDWGGLYGGLELYRQSLLK